MDTNRDLPRENVSAVNGLPRRRKRVATLREPTDQEVQDRQMELLETVRLGGDEREFPKKRRFDRSTVQQRNDGGESCKENSTDSSDEEYYEEEGMRIHSTNQLSPPSSSLLIHRHGLRKHRSSPILRAAVNEIFGFPVPRRARSSSAKRLHEYCHSGSGSFGDDFSRWRSSPYTAGLFGSGDSMKKKMRSVERRTTPISNHPKLSVIQDDIEIEVAEALFDLMKQSQSQSQSRSSQSHVDRDSVIPATDELKMPKADGGKEENNAFSVQNEPSMKVNAETVLADSMIELKKEVTVEKEKFSDESAQDLVIGDGFVNKVRVGSPKESESPSCVKVNACDIQDPTVTKANYDAIIVEAKKETKLDIDLMVSPLLSSLERDGLVNMRTDPGVVPQTVRKGSEVISKDGSLAVASGMPEEMSEVVKSNQQSNLNVEKHNLDTTHRQAPTSLLTFPYGVSGWCGIVADSGFMPPLHPVMPINGNLKSSTIMQPPQFRFSQSRPKRCATHQFLAQSMHCHEQLIRKSLSSESAGPASLCRAKSPNRKYISEQDFISGNTLLADFQGRQNSANASVGSGMDKSSDAAVALNATTSSKPLLHQASHPASASSLLHGPGFVLPFGHQATMMGPANSSGSPQCNSAGRLPVNLALPNSSTSMSMNLAMFPSNEAASYVAMFHNNGCSVPISTSNIAMPSFNGPPSTAFLNPSLYPSPAFNVTQNQQQLATSHDSVQSATQNINLLSHKQPHCANIRENKFPNSATANSQLEKPAQLSQLSSKSDTEINWNGASLATGFVPHSVKHSNLQTCSLTAQPMNFSMIPPVPVVGGAAGNKQNSKDRVELIPQSYGLSLDSNASTTQVLNFSSMTQTSAMFQMLPGMSRNGNQMIHQKNFLASDGKYLTTGGQSFNYSKSDCSDLSALSTMRPPKFDGVARNINFFPSSLTGSQPFQTSPAAVSSDSQQHQLIQVQDFQMHPAGSGQVNSSTPRNIPRSFFTGILPSSSPLYTQVPAPNNNPKWEKLPKSEESPQTQLKSYHGQTHISFGNGPISPFQGHPFMIKSESMSSSNSSLSRHLGISSQRNASDVATTPALPSQDAEASQGGASQKSSPSCKPNVPSMLSFHPGQLPDLKN